MDLPASEWFNDPDYWRENRSFIWSEKRIELSAAEAERMYSLLGMKPGDSVLDLACGFGRHSLPLAEKGCSVTGIDLNESFIKEASNRAEELGLEARFVCVDMRDFREPESFDHVIITYNSFGYFQDQADDRRVVGNCFQSLRPGGKLLIQDVTREVITAFRAGRQSRYWFEEADGTIRLEETMANEDFTWNTTRWIILRGSSRREYRYGMRIYSTDEYIELFEEAGFSSPRVHGGFSGRPYDSGKDHLVLVLEKPGR